jgi:hypothetical protein
MAEKKLDYLEMNPGVYLIETSFGKVHGMKPGVSAYQDKDFEYVGRIHKGEVKFVVGADLSSEIPVRGDYDYGYTLEGPAQRLFTVEDALDKRNADENRTFCYIKPGSRLLFVGDGRKNYHLYVRCFPQGKDERGSRWLVLYAVEA